MLDRKWRALYLGQPQAVRGETDIIDLSNSEVSSLLLCMPPLKPLLCTNTPKIPHVKGQYDTLNESGSFTHIHVHPDVVLFANVRNGNEGVKSSVHCCPSSRTYEERYKTLHKSNQNTAYEAVMLLQYVPKFPSSSLQFQSSAPHKIKTV